MNISKLSNINFQAKIIGNSYNKIKNMSIDNGLSQKDVLDAENKIHSAFPNDTLEINSRYKSGITTLNIELKKNSNSFMNLGFRRTFEIETKTDEQVKNLFVSLAEKVEEVKNMFASRSRKNPKEVFVA